MDAEIEIERDYQEQLFRDEITEDFKKGRIGIVNGWLVEYADGEATPIADLWKGWFS